MKVSAHTRKPFDRSLLLCLLASLVTAALTFAYFIWKGGGALTITSDFNNQQLTFAAAIQTVLKEQAAGEWCWNLDLGSSLINGFSFYDLGSIFYWISFLFPKTWFPYLVGFIYMLKYVVASLTAYLYLKRFVREKNWAVVGALLYAFSGFQATNLLFYHFHDVVAFFPLLLLGLEEMLDPETKKGTGLFIFAVFLNCIVNYFFFVQDVVFLVLYYLLRFWSGSIQKLLRGALKCLVCGVLGVGMAAILLVPSVLYLLGSARANVSCFYLSQLLYDTRYALFLIKGMLFPGDAMGRYCAVLQQKWNSTACYLPFVSMSLAVAYIAGRRKDWLKRLLIILLIVSFSPLLSGAFLAFTATYQRWWYTFTLMLALASAQVLDRPKEYNIGKAAMLTAGAALLFYLVIRYVPWTSEPEPLIYNGVRFGTGLVLAVVGPVLLALLDRFRQGKYQPILLLTMCFSIAATGLTMHYYRSGTTSVALMDTYRLGTRLPLLDDQYRYNTANNMLTLPGQAAGIGCFSSTIENSSREFNTLFDNTDKVLSANTETRGLSTLLGGKYRISKEAGAGTLCDTVESDGTTYYIYEDAACPIGFYVDHYITKDDLLALELDNRAAALMNAVVVEQEDVAQVQDTATELQTDTLDFANGLETYANRCAENSVDDFSRDTSGFTCRTDAAEDTLVFFSVPYDTGWTATVDGEETEIIDTCGLMALDVSAGAHDVKFVYHTPGFRAGILLSAVSWGIYALYGVIGHRRAKRKPC